MNVKKKRSFKVLHIRLEEDIYRKWKKLSFKKETTMAEMIRELVDEKLKECKKVLT